MQFSDYAARGTEHSEHTEFLAPGSCMVISPTDNIIDVNKKRSSKKSSNSESNRRSSARSGKTEEERGRVGPRDSSKSNNMGASSFEADESSRLSTSKKRGKDQNIKKKSKRSTSKNSTISIPLSELERQRDVGVIVEVPENTTVGSSTKSNKKKKKKKNTEESRSERASARISEFSRASLVSGSVEV